MRKRGPYKPTTRKVGYYVRLSPMLLARMRARAAVDRFWSVSQQIDSALSEWLDRQEARDQREAINARRRAARRARQEQTQQQKGR